MSLIQIENVNYSYKTTLALSDVTFSVDQGDSIALIGPNGSGKSTLLKLINGIVLPETGRYYFDGAEINENRMKDPSYSRLFHSRIGFLMQNSDAQLFCSNVYEEIAFGPRQMGLPDEETNKRVIDCLMLLDIEKLKHREPYHLSEGEKRKTALASVLAMNPDVLVLDEPMNGLDPKTKHFLKDLLITLHQAGKTIICSTHDFSYVDGIFSQAAVFSEGHTIVKKGDYQEMTGDEVYLKSLNIL